MKAYLMTDDEAFETFSGFAQGELYSRCECERDVGYTCDDCRRIAHFVERFGIDWDDYMWAKSRAMAKRMMRRRLVAHN